MSDSHYHAAARLELLPIFDDDERHREVQTLLDDNDKHRTGTMLFKFHTMSDKPGAALACSSEDVADDVFRSLSDEQKRYWALETCKLAAGNCSPLYTSALNAFLGLHYPHGASNDHHKAAIGPYTYPQTPRTPSPGPEAAEGTPSSETDSTRTSVNSAASDLSDPFGRSPVTSKHWDNGGPHKQAPLHKYARITKLTVTEADREEITKYPILRGICANLSLRSLFHEEIIDKVLKFLDARFCRDHDEVTNLVGRYRGIQLNYDPGATNVRGIRARLFTSLTRKVYVDQAGEAVTDQLAEMEALLRAIVAWNRSGWVMSEFASLSIPGEQDDRVYSEEYGSCINWFLSENSHLLPVSQQNKIEVVSTMMMLLMERSNLHSGHQLVRYGARDVYRFRRTNDQERIRRFSLKDSTTGFAVELMSCFSHSGLTSEEYLDFLEQKLYLMHREFPALDIKDPEFGVW